MIKERLFRGAVCGLLLFFINNIDMLDAFIFSLNGNNIIFLGQCLSTSMYSRSEKSLSMPNNWTGLD